MKRIGRGDRVIAILSAAYLESPFCMTELNYIYERSLDDKADFLKRIVPIVLEDAKIFTWEARADHAEFWEGQYQAMEKRLTYLGAEDFKRFKLMQRWHANIGDILSFIADKLAPIGFDQAAADDYKAVRDLLG